jgi:hypothetical protein
MASTSEPAPVRRRRRLLLVATVLATVIAVLTGGTAYADPDPDGPSSDLAAKLTQLAEGYYSAKAALTASQQRQADLTVKLRDAQLALTRLAVGVDAVAAARYEGEQLSIVSGLISGSAQGDTRTLLQGAAIADFLVWQDDEQIRQYSEARDTATKAQADLDNELKLQAKAVADLDTQKRNAEKALAAVGGMVTAGYNGPAQPAQPAPRNADGSWPRESASINDPTGTGGKITPRMVHTLYEAQLAGFTRYTACYRPATFGEHPLGRACDFSATKGGFASAIASGDDKAYGTRLAAWGVANADALGVMYVIWFRQIWMPGLGWRAYDAAGTDPASEHENHVHISVL